MYEKIAKEEMEKLENLGAQIIDGKIPILELIFYAEKGYVKRDWKKLLDELGKKDMLFFDRYEILKKLRERGYITRLSLENPEYFRLHRKGFRPGVDRTAYLLKVIQKIDLNEMQKDLEFAGKMRKELVYAINGNPQRYIKISRSSFE